MTTTPTSNGLATIASPVALQPPLQPQSLSSPQNLTLTIRQAGEPDRTVALPRGKCTVGSSQSCQIRLHSSAVRPLHCLIVHDSDKTVVTRWASGALLNGNDFSSTAFRPGDCLTLGEFEIQLAAAPASTKDVSAASFVNSQSTPVQPARPNDTLRSPSTPSPSHSKALEKKYRSANDTARRRCRDLIASLRTIKTETTQLGSRMEQLQSELKAVQEKLHSEQSIGQESLAQHAQLQSNLTALEQERDLFLQEKTEDASRFSLLEQMLAERDGKIDTYETELQQSRESLDSAHQQKESQHEEYQRLQSELAELAQQRDQFQEELTDKQSQQGDLQQAFSEQEGRMSGLQNELRQASMSLEAAHQQSSEQQEERQRLQEELAELTQQRDQFQEELANEQSQQGGLQAELDRACESLRITQEEKVEQEKTCERLESDLSSLQADHDQLDTIRIEIREENRKLEEQLYGRDERLQEMSDSLQQSLSTSIDLESLADEKSSAYQELVVEMEQLKLGQDTFLQEREADQQRLAELEPVLQQRDGELNQLREQAEQASRTIQDVQQQQAEQVGLREQLEQQLDELNLQRDQLQDESSHRQQLLETQAEELANREQNIAALNESLQQHQLHLQELTTLVEQHQSARELLETEKAELLTRSEQFAGKLQSEQWQREEIERAAEESKKNTELLQVDIQSARTELKQSAQRIAQFEQMRNSAEEELQQLRASLDAKQEQLNQTDELDSQQQADQKRLASELKTEQQTSAAARQRIESLQVELQELRDSNHVSETGENQNREQMESLDAEKASLEERIREQDARLELISTELQQAQSRCTEGESQLEQLEEHYQQTLQDLQSAHDCLMEAQEMLQNQAAVSPEESVEVVQEETKEETVEETAEEEPTFAPEVVEPLDDPEKESPREAFTIAPEEHACEENSEENPEAEVSEPNAPEQPSFIEQYSHLFENEDGLEDGINNQPTQPTSLAPVAVTPNPLLASADDSDEGAMEAYMANLMQRVRGEEVLEVVSAPLQRPTTEPEQSQASAVDTVSERISNVSEVSSEQEPLAPLELSDLKQSRASETTTDLTALRELANSTTRQAIASHRRKRHLEMGFGKLLTCGVSAGVGIYLVLTAEGFYNMTFVAGCVASFAGLYWGAQLLVLLLQAIRDGAPVQAKPAEISADEEPLPIDG